jgi:two-component system chemotaxis response regulator CheY
MTVEPRRRVLVVDDALTIRSFLASTLSGAGFEVDAAMNGIEGLERAMMATPALVISDINMPRMDGFRMVRALRANPETQDVPVVMLSTECREGDRAEAWRAGANHFLIKPPRRDELIAVARLLTAGTGR